MLEIISERTGYPVEMIEPDLDLEADLSIDSIKRTEIAGELAARGSASAAPDAVGSPQLDERSWRTLARPVRPPRVTGLAGRAARRSAAATGPGIAGGAAPDRPPAPSASPDAAAVAAEAPS